jgi:hypothetical protein
MNCRDDVVWELFPLSAVDNVPVVNDGHHEVKGRRHYTVFVRCLPVASVKIKAMIEWMAV